MSLLDRLSLAERALGRLDGITTLLPRQELFLYMYVRKEAVLSSQIEGTQSGLPVISAPRMTLRKLCKFNNFQTTPGSAENLGVKVLRY